MRANLLTLALCSTVAAATALVLGCAGDRADSPASHTAAQAATAAPAGSAVENSYARLADATHFTVFYGNNIAAKANELQSSLKINATYHAIRGPLSALDGQMHEVALGDAADWTFIMNIPLFDGKSDVLTNVVLAGNVPGISGYLAVQGLAQSDGMIVAEYRVQYQGSNPHDGTPWEVTALAPRRAAAFGRTGAEE